MTRNHKARARSEASFSLIETVIALAIVSFLILEVAAVQGNSIVFADYGRNVTQAGWLAKRVMSQVEYYWRTKPFKDLETNVVDQKFEDFDEYSYSLEIKEWKFPFTQLISQVLGGGDAKDEDGEKKAPEAVTGIPTGTPPAVVTMPATPMDAAKTAREKASGRKPGKLAIPIPGVTQQTPEAPPVEKVIATPPPVAKGRGKPVKPGIVKPFNPPVDDNQPAGNVRMATTPPPAEKVTAATPPPVGKQRVAPVRPGIVKPFNPPVDDNQPAGSVRMAATPPPVNKAIEKNNAAAEAAKKQAAVKEAARQRVMEQNGQQQQEIARRKNNDAQEAAVARQRMLQQQQVEQKQQVEAVTRKRAVDASQMQQQQQQQLVRERAAQAAETKQRALQSQQSQAAAIRQQAAENAQAQAAARKKAPVMQVQPPRNVAPPVQQRNLPPAIQQQKVPVKPGKKPLTPEEAAAQQQQLLR